MALTLTNIPKSVFYSLTTNERLLLVVRTNTDDENDLKNVAMEKMSQPTHGGSLDLIAKESRVFKGIIKS